METIQRYHYIVTFFAGAFLTNAIPHFVNGISGNCFATPFAKPQAGTFHAVGEYIVACFNIVIGYILLRTSEVSPNKKLLLFAFFIGILFTSIMLSTNFSKKVKNNGTKQQSENGAISNGCAGSYCKNAW